ncbi:MULTISPECIES: hypothetical protein [unclassified Streptomyces]|uniref:hypothetical protein n=1 Tax=unclassified Streptomyces TaxID=2593676 RepID=UPI001F03ED88|nr:MULTISPECIES: hypothetical protein [unclassified Streptomyces]MCH0566670.1 hypothetical protein [Streptomyces sp. MUM 2J]MCH0573420.1 hypothetical protein [Streptomyces sp. MUM 136J]
MCAADLTQGAATSVPDVDFEARVLVCPAYGSKESRRHWHDTLEQEVPFGEKSLTRHLSSGQLEQLSRIHPSGMARFWGATSTHDKAMSGVRTGDVALFTGAKKVLAVGEVGVIFVNREVADTLWPPSPGGKSWHTVYSLRDLVPAEVPYEELAELIGYSKNYGFPGQLVLQGSKARAVIEGLRITTRTVLEQLGIEKSPASSLLPVQRTQLEQQHTPVVRFERAATTTLYRREEQPLVTEFCATLTVAAERFRSPAGLCDIYVQGPDGVELIEAKSRAGHAYVREALSQLLDYAPHSPRPVDRLAVLLPESPGERELQLLHRYGVDCIHRVSPGGFRRVPAPDDRRHLMRRLWTEN